MARSSTTRHGKGRGIGGPASGSRRIENRPSFEPGHDHVGSHTRYLIEAKLARDEQAARDADDALAGLRYTMLTAARDADRTVAQVAMLDRRLGKATQRSVHEFGSPETMDDADLDAAIAAAAAGGQAPEDGSD